jgi:glycosyltransferase involved in cell wall biosynthesis
MGMRPTRPNILAFLRLVRLIRQLRPTVIQTWLYHGDFFGGLAARCAGRREIVWGIRNTGFVERSSRMTVVIMRACALLSKHVPRVIVCCAQSARASHKKWGYCSPRMRVIPNGFVLPDLSQRRSWRQALRKELGLDLEGIVVGMIARFDPLKNHELFIQAATALARSHREVKFMLVGRNVDDTNPQLMRWIAESGIPERFVLTGQRRDINHCLAAMDVLCLTSTFEGFPNVVAEGMAMGVPCVVTDAGDARHIVADTGWVVPVKDASQLSDVLGSVVSMSPALLRQRGELARRRIEQHFSVAATLRLFELAYLDAIDDRKQSNRLVEDN